ncbi:MAG: site-specific integrase [Bryobacteraceae bacterium]
MRGLKNTVDVRSLIHLYVTTLEARGYRPSVIGAYRAAVEHFVSWAAPNGDRLQVSKAAVRDFLNVHLADCRCLGRIQRGVVTVRSALNHLLMVLGERKLASEVQLSAHLDIELQKFCEYASDVCGLAPATLISRRQWIGRYLAHQFPKGSVEVSRLSPKQIRDFFSSQCRGYRPGTAQVIASAIRSYLRFRALQHADQVESLLAAVPSAACWRLAALPKYLETDEVALLMAAFDRTLPQHQRDYAILRCLVDLGLRSCEVSALRLDDIDWKNGTLTVRTEKSQRCDVLPLPSTTGRAIAEYLRKARPANESRAVFVRHRAPFHLPVSPSVIRSVVRQAAVRSGLMDRLHGPHRLRHSAATRMLHQGATLKQIADILRHRSLDTTAIYAKVDVPRLAAIAQPWPGGAA